MEYWKNIGSNIRTLRKSRGLTMEDLAYVLDIAPGFLGLVERGTRGVSLANLAKICSFFDVTLETMIRGTVTPEPYVPENDTLKRKAKDLAFSLTEEEIKIVVSNMKKVMAYKNQQHE